MSLTPEEMKRIEEEEHRRLAEEQYRVEVRARLQTPPVPAGVPLADKTRSRWAFAGVFILAVTLTVAGVFVYQRATRDETSPKDGASPKRARSVSFFEPKIRRVPMSTKVASGQITVKAGQIVRFPIRITPEMKDARLTGSFNASGGSGNDILAILTTADELENWVNGHEAKGLYGTSGKKTTDRFSLALAPGDYILAFSNQFSSFSEKQVFLEVEINYMKEITEE